MRHRPSLPRQVVHNVRSDTLAKPAWLALAAMATVPSMAHADGPDGSADIDATATTGAVAPVTDATEALDSVADDGGSIAVSAMLRNRLVLQSGAPMVPYTPPGAVGPAGPYPQQGAVDPALWARYNALPRRGGTIVLGVFGGLWVAGGLGYAIAGSMACSSVDEYDYYYGDSSCGLGLPLGVGLGQAALGGLMLGFSIRRAKTRRAGLDELRQQGMYWVDQGAPRLHLSVMTTPRSVGPVVTMTF